MPVNDKVSLATSVGGVMILYGTLLLMNGSGTKDEEKPLAAKSAFSKTFLHPDT